MNNLTRIIFASTLMLLSYCFLPVSGQETAKKHGSGEPGEIRDLKSSVDGREYELLISYPEAYQRDTT